MQGVSDRILGSIGAEVRGTRKSDAQPHPAATRADDIASGKAYSLPESIHKVSEELRTVGIPLGNGSSDPIDTNVISQGHGGDPEHQILAPI